MNNKDTFIIQEIPDPKASSKFPICFAKKISVIKGLTKPLLPQEKAMTSG